MIRRGGSAAAVHEDGGCSSTDLLLLWKKRDGVFVFFPPMQYITAPESKNMHLTERSR